MVKLNNIATGLHKASAATLEEFQTLAANRKVLQRNPVVTKPLWRMWPLWAVYMMLRYNDSQEFNHLK